MAFKCREIIFRNLETCFHPREMSFRFLKVMFHCLMPVFRNPEENQLKIDLLLFGGGDLVLSKIFNLLKTNLLQGDCSFLSSILDFDKS